LTSGEASLGKFKSVVNMSPASLRIWLKTPESQSVGMTGEGERVTEAGGHEAVGHQIGGRILSCRRSKPLTWTITPPCGR
jgi:hypothetical protein